MNTTKKNIKNITNPEIIIGKRLQDVLEEYEWSEDIMPIIENKGFNNTIVGLVNMHDPIEEFRGMEIDDLGQGEVLEVWSYIVF